MMELAQGTPEQKQMVQDAVNRFWYCIDDAWSGVMTIHQ